MFPDKSIMVEATGLNFFTVQHHFVQRCAFLPTVAAPMVLPKLSCVPFSTDCVGDDLLYAHYGFSVSAVLAGVLLMLFFVWDVT